MNKTEKLSDITNSEFKIFNQDNLNNFDKEDQKELIDLFLQTSTENIKIIKESFEKNNIKEVLFHIHKLKGSASVIGAERLFNYTETIEKELKNNKDLPGIWLEKLKIIYNETIKEFKNYLIQF